MSNEETSAPFKNTEALFATVARLFALDGDLLAVDVLSSGKPRFEWYTHDNWDGGFDIYNLYIEIELSLFSKIEDTKQSLEQKILDKLQSISQGHTSDHIQSVAIILEITEGKDWRNKAKKWASGNTETGETTSPVETIPIQPEVFQIPSKPIDEECVSVMMPFAKEFDGTYESIKKASQSIGMKSVRADNVWSNSTFIQDIFELIYCSKIVIIDFSNKNPNVMYEAGIAHTLGRHVIPITQSIDDLPSDIVHHRALKYLANQEGLNSLVQGLTIRLSTITGREPSGNG